jgi:ACDE family multidrug resistance protein
MLRNPQLLILLAAGTLTTMTGGVVAPVLPEVITQLDLDPVLAGNLVSMHCLTIALFSPVLGIFADRYSKLGVLIPSLALYGLFGVAGAFMNSFWPLLLTRAFLGAASGGIAAASLGLLSNLYEEPQRSKAIGYITGALTITGILFPVMGGWVGSFGWQAAFYLYAVAWPLAILAALILKSKRRSGKSISIDAKPLKKLLADSTTVQLLINVSLASMTMYAFLIYLPQYLKLMAQAGTITNGIVLASTALGTTAISAFGASRLAKKWGVFQVISVGFGMMAAMLIVIAQFSQVPLILPAAILFGVGFGLVLPSLYAALANLAPAEVRSSVLAAGTGAGFLGQFLAPILLGPVLGIGGFVGVFYGAAVISMMAGLLLVFREKFKFN